MFGVAMVLRLVVIMVVAPLLVMTTPLPEMMIAFVKFKIPYRFAFVMTTAMSMLPSNSESGFPDPASPALPRRERFRRRQFSTPNCVSCQPCWFHSFWALSVIRRCWMWR